MASSSADIMLQHAVAALRAGNTQDAETRLKNLIAAHPDHIAGLNVYGILLMQLGRFDEAEKYLKLASDKNATFDTTHYNYGIVLKALKRPNEALQRFNQALAINSSIPETWNNRGAVFNDLERYKEAISDFDKALSINPNYAEAFYNKGKSLAKLKFFDEALGAYDRALSLKSDFAEAWLGRGNIFAELRQYDDALAAYGWALSLKPDLVEAWIARGSIHAELRQHNDALAAYDRVLSLKTDHAEAWLWRGNILTELGKCDEALTAYDRALSLKSDFAEAWLGRGNAFSLLKQYDAALSAYDNAIAIKPDFAEAHFNKAGCHLRLGEFKLGLEEYEWRWQTKYLKPYMRNFPQPQWRGSEKISDRVLLLHAEQGFGDTFQFCRYVPLVAKQCARVILEVPKPIYELMSTLSGASQIVCASESLPDFDFHCPLGSLPLAFGTRLATIPANVPYLSAPKIYSEKWAQRLPKTDDLRVGINWAGSQNFGSDHRRSIGLAPLSPVLSCPNIHFFSIQKDLRAGDQEILQDHPQVTVFGTEINTFGDTAAILSMMDLVISSDTSVVHLAGALGKPVWILLQPVPDWRWLNDRNDSPWYPTARLFRQKTTFVWDDVVSRVKTALQDFVQNRS